MQLRDWGRILILKQHLLDQITDALGEHDKDTERLRAEDAAADVDDPIRHRPAAVTPNTALASGQALISKGVAAANAALAQANRVASTAIAEATAFQKQYCG